MHLTQMLILDSHYRWTIETLRDGTNIFGSVNYLTKPLRKHQGEITNHKSRNDRQHNGQKKQDKKKRKNDLLNKTQSNTYPTKSRA